MNSEKLHDALNYIDDELIEETNLCRQKSSHKKYIVLGMVSGFAAACLFVFIGVLVMIFISGGNAYYDSDDKLMNETATHRADDILAVTDGIDEETIPSETQYPQEHPFETMLPSEVPNATSDEFFDEPAFTNVPQATSGGEDSSDYIDEPDDAPGEAIPPGSAMECKILAEVVSVGAEAFKCEVIDNKNAYFVENGDVIEVEFGDLTDDEVRLLSVDNLVYVTLHKTESLSVYVADKVERSYW